MFISIFDLFKIGIGPSSSHTMGPMVAAQRFIKRSEFKGVEKVKAIFYGSLAFTGKGHESDKAVMRALSESDFNGEVEIVFDYGDPLPEHPNGMTFIAYDRDKNIVLERSYYSIGGGFVLSEDEIDQYGKDNYEEKGEFPYPFKNANEMLDMGNKYGLSIAQMKKADELVKCSQKELDEGINNIWRVMNACIERGLKAKGILPGSLNIKRRAADIKQQLDDEKLKNLTSPHICNEWLSLYAMAVNEENASGGEVVTAPTNGAAGVVPAVLRYYLDFIPDASEENISTFLLTAAAIGGIIKNNASISGAEVGCQGEVGSASAMAAAGLCAVMGGTNEQIENAAEIALEHHLGMTCDPVAGLVQVPCIERNGLGAVKAVTASSLALRGDGKHFISLDRCIETMHQTGIDMHEKYKETSLGGLAVNFIEC